jgi:hypothetical protein
MTIETEDYEFATCPFCGMDEECEHLFGAYDPFDYSLVGGYLFDHEGPILDVMIDYFQEKIEKYGFRMDVFIEDSGFAFEIWKWLLEEKESSIKSKWEFDLNECFPLHFAVQAILDCSECERIDAYEPSGPFLGSSYNYYTDKGMEEVYNTIKNSIREYLENEFNHKL